MTSQNLQQPNTNIILPPIYDDSIISNYILWEELQNTELRDEWCLKSGIASLDTDLDGFFPGEVTVISGRTGEGKTLFSQTLTRHFFYNKHNCLWFSYEVRPFLFLKQFGNPMPEFFMPKKLQGQNMKWLIAKIREGVEKYQVKAIFIDHLHYLVSLNNSSFNTSFAMGYIMRTLVNLVHELKIHIFLMAHMSKTKSDAEPGKGDIRDSSLIEQEADNVFYMWRKEDISNGSVLKVAKNRRNGIFNKKIHLIKDEFFLKEDINAYSDEKRYNY